MGLAVGMCALLGYFFIPSLHNMAGYLIKIACIFILVHTALSNLHMKMIFSAKPIIIIGGMCYSIYLLHLAVISFMGRLLMKSGTDVSDKSLVVPFVLVLIVSVLIISAVYFLLVEKPFMRPIGLGKSKGPNK
jgi:peptidoglycan/LPS O-acetylase OafA/YrhL